MTIRKGNSGFNQKVILIIAHYSINPRNIRQYPDVNNEEVRR
jgi:hypothetical protein